MWTVLFQTKSALFQMGLIDSKKISRLFSLRKREKEDAKKRIFFLLNLLKKARTYEHYENFNWKLLYVIMYHLHLW